jgi:hypothetical protein
MLTPNRDDRYYHAERWDHDSPDGHRNGNEHHRARRADSHADHRARTTTADATPLGTLHAYWDGIAAGRYATAWHRLAPGAGQPESEFAGGERQEGITGTSLSGHVSANDGSTVTARVDSATTSAAALGRAPIS